MAVVVPYMVLGTGTHWAFAATHTFDNADNNAIVYGELRGIKEYGDLVIVDGVSVYQGNFSVADETVSTWVYSSVRGGAALEHLVGRFVTTAAENTHGDFFYPIGVMSALTTAPFIRVTVDDAVNLDTVLFSAWGHYAPTPLTEPQEVTVKGVQFSMPKKKVGPI